MFMEKKLNGFLVLTRSKGQSLLVGDDIEIAISDFNTKEGTVSVAVRAPKSTKILRAEVIRRDQEIITRT